LLVIPVLKVPFCEPKKSQSVFLGAILRDSDLVFFPSPQKTAGVKPLGVPKDLSRESYFDRTPFELHKPAVLLEPQALSQKENGVSRVPPVIPREVREVSFGFRDFGEYVENIDFSDLKNYSSNDDISSYADFQVFLTQDGRVAEIKKVAGSGDPAVDLIIVRKLKKAVFKPLFAKGAWIRVRFNIK